MCVCVRVHVCVCLYVCMSVSVCVCVRAYRACLQMSVTLHGGGLGLEFFLVSGTFPEWCYAANESQSG